MIRLPETLAAWGTPAFADRLRQELIGLGADALPLQQGLASGSYVHNGDIGVMLLGVAETPGAIQAKVGVFYQGVIAGCSCADDPTPVDTTTEYCQLRLEIDRGNAETKVILLPS
jgi:hypothetical protein